MRYLLLLRGAEAEFVDRPQEALESEVAFLSRFEDELAVSSELEWSEVLGSDAQVEFVSPGGLEESERPQSAGAPLRRIWAIRVENEARALALAGELADGVAARIEVRECLASSQRP